MYVPKQFEESRIEVLHGLIEAHPLASLVSLESSGLNVNHIPMLLDPSRGEFGVLCGHVARANPMWHELSGSAESVAVFHGPNSYVSPSWYPSKAAHGMAVPTWNYAVVHARGVARAIEDPAWLLAHVTALSARHEATQALPWKVSDAPPEFIGALVHAIVGIEIPIRRLEGKWKMSQNRPTGDALGVIAGLEARGDENSRAIADNVRRALK